MLRVLLPGVQGQDEVLFQFGDSKGWHHAKHVGTVTPYQAWLALKKLGRDDYDVTKVLGSPLSSLLDPYCAVQCHAQAHGAKLCRNEYVQVNRPRAAAREL